jgi:hypothetical protein
LRRAQRGSPAGVLAGRLASSGRRISLTSRKLSQPYLRLLEVGGIEALSAPAVHLRQQLVSLLAFALLLPQAAQAQRRLQLSGCGLLMVGHSEGLVKAGFGRGRMQYGTSSIPQ